MPVMGFKLLDQRKTFENLTTHLCEFSFPIITDFLLKPGDINKRGLKKIYKESIKIRPEAGRHETDGHTLMWAGGTRRNKPKNLYTYVHSHVPGHRVGKNWGGGSKAWEEGGKEGWGGRHL